jgi:hypothetical protein
MTQLPPSQLTTAVGVSCGPAAVGAVTRADSERVEKAIRKAALEDNQRQILGMANDAVVTNQLALKLVTDSRPDLARPTGATASATSSTKADCTRRHRFFCPLAEGSTPPTNVITRSSLPDNPIARARLPVGHSR